MGINKSQLRARESLFWPNINSDIENFVNNCDTCLNFRNSNTDEPLITSEVPTKPWEVVGTDLYQFNNQNFIIVIDYFSKFIETSKLNKLDSISTISTLKSIFARHGIPNIIRSDQGTNYSSEEFKNFVNDWGIQHIMSSPTHAQSNGMVERCIQTFKNLMKKAEYDEIDPYLSLLEYRCTPISHEIPSPSKLLFNRNVNSLLPKFDCLKQGGKMEYDKVKYNLEKRQISQKHYFDKKTKTRKDFEVGNSVRVQGLNKTWTPGEITAKANKPRTYLVRLNNGKVMERNKKYLIKDSCNKINKTPKTSFTPIVKFFNIRKVNKPSRLNDYVCK